MRVLGIDPGTLIMGYGVIDCQDSEVSLVKYGAFNTPSRSPIGERLIFLYNNLTASDICGAIPYGTDERKKQVRQDHG